MTSLFSSRFEEKISDVVEQFFLKVNPKRGRWIVIVLRPFTSMNNVASTNFQHGF